MGVARTKVAGSSVGADEWCKIRGRGRIGDDSKFSERKLSTTISGKPKQLIKLIQRIEGDRASWVIGKNLGVLNTLKPICFRLQHDVKRRVSKVETCTNCWAVNCLGDFMSQGWTSLLQCTDVVSSWCAHCSGTIVVNLLCNVTLRIFTLSASGMTEPAALTEVTSI